MLVSGAVFWAVETIVGFVMIGEVCLNLGRFRTKGQIWNFLFQSWRCHHQRLKILHYFQHTVVIIVSIKLKQSLTDALFLEGVVVSEC